MPKATKKTAYLVIHVYPGGEHVMVVFATNEDEITKRYPPLRVIAEPPPWVDEQMIAKMTSKAHDVDNPETWLPDFINPPHSVSGTVRIS
jgi:hypothetical protein